MDQWQTDSRRILIVDDALRIYADFQAVLSDDQDYADLERPYEALFPADGPPLAPEPPRGYELLYAAQGQEACDLVAQLQEEERSVALAFVGLEMPPGCEGLETIRALWELDSRMEIVICTADAGHSWTETAARLGHRDQCFMLKKPCDVVQVVQLAAALTTKWRQARQAEWNTGQLEKMADERTRALEAANAQIAQYTHQLSAILDWLPVGILIYDPRKSCVHDLNMVAISVLGLSREQVIHRPLDEVLVSVRSPAAMESLLHGQTTACEDRLIIQHGQRVPVLRTTFPVMLEGRQYALISFLDISDTKQLDEQRRQLEERKRQAGKMKSLFVMAGSIAHHFNNLLQAITGYIELAMLNAPTSDSDLQDNLQSADSAAKRAAELGALMLTYVGQRQFSKKKEQINHIVQDAVHALPRERQSQIKCVLDPDLPMVSVGRAPIQRCVENILHNSLDAISPTTGAIRLSTYQRYCDIHYLRQTVLGDESQEGQYVVIEISDNGIGMDPETTAKLFDPFFSTKMVGRGLGLAVVLGTMRSHRGAVTVYSELGQGTMMRLLLLCPDGATPSASSRSEWALDDGKPRGGVALVVDDEDIIREITQHMLERMGFETLTAGNGKEALQMIRDRQGGVDIVLLDVLMPEMSGPDMLVELRKTHPDMPVIIISGYSEEKVSGQFDQMVMPEFLQKPFSAIQLKSCIRDILK